MNPWERVIAVLLQWSAIVCLQEESVTPVATNEDCGNDNTHSICNLTAIYRRILKGYSKGLRPFLDDHEPVVITVGLWILSIDSVNVVDMDYRIDLFLRQQWRDPRLEHGYHKPVTVDNSLVNKIWVPDTYFYNSKTSKFHHVTVPNTLLRISPNGTVMYVTRITLTASCPMNLLDFPADTQLCNLLIESYGYDMSHILYRWESDDTKIYIKDKATSLPQYNLTNFTTGYTHSYYVSGNRSTLEFKFVLRRQVHYFLLHLYAPCTLIVIISWIAFFIPQDSVPARISLGITSMLTTTTIINMHNQSMPKVAYIKLADCHLIVCLLFIFGTLIEYTVILYLMGRQKKIKDIKDITADHPVNTSTMGFQQEKAVRCNKMHVEETLNKSRMFVSVNLESIDEYARLLFPMMFAIYNVYYWISFLRKEGSTHFHY